MATSGSSSDHRLKNAREFDAVFKRASFRASSAEFLVLAIRNPHAISRLGMVVSKKTAGTSVNRNRIRRLIREAFRLKFDRSGLDVVVVARPPVRRQDNARILAALERLWGSLSEKDRREH